MVNNENVYWPGWEVVEKIGQGGFGTVYKIQRDVFGDMEYAALKVISIPYDVSEIEHLRCEGFSDESITKTFHDQVGDIMHEYKIMSLMRESINIVHCDDFKCIQNDDGLGWKIYIKMELLKPLTKSMDKVHTEEQIIQLGIAICNALEICEEMNIIHRDIKPQNVFISDKGHFKLGDFGIARTIERTTKATARIGTHSYMAPEIANGKAYGAKADIYSLGLMMYWLLNERRGPFVPLPPEVPTYQDTENANRLRVSGKALPCPVHGSPALLKIVLKACAWNPKDRYSSATEMRDALMHISEELDLTVMDDPQCKKDLNKKKQSSTIVAAALCLSLFVAISTMFIREKNVTGSIVDSRPTTKLTVTPTEDQREVAYKNAISLCKELASKHAYSDLMKHLKDIIAAETADDRYQELLKQYESEFQKYTVVQAEVYADQGNYKQAALTIIAAQEIFDCAEFQGHLVFYRNQLLTPLSHCNMIESSNEEGSTTDVEIGDWEDVHNVTHDDAIKFWVVDRLPWASTEHIVFELGGHYKTLSGSLVAGIYSNANSYASIMVYLDGRLVYTSEEISDTMQAADFKIDVSGIQEIRIECTTSSYQFNYCIMDAVVSEI